MKIDDAINLLNNLKKQNVKNIILALWLSENFTDRDGNCFVNDSVWAALSDAVDNKMDWSHTHDNLQRIVMDEESEPV